MAKNYGLSPELAYAVGGFPITDAATPSGQGALRHCTRRNNVRMTPFGYWLNRLRLDAGIRQQDLAVRIGVKPAYLSALQAGRKGPPDDEFITRIRDVLELNPDEVELLRAAAKRSSRRLSIPANATPAEYCAAYDFIGLIGNLTNHQVRVIQEMLRCFGIAVPHEAVLPSVQEDVM